MRDSRLGQRLGWTGILVSLAAWLLAAMPALAADEAALAYFRQAKINWRQFDGQKLSIALNKHPFTESLLPQIPEFEALTGIKVEYLILPEN